MNQNIFITGVAGFIGSNLAKKLLANGFKVTGIDNLAAGTLENIPVGVDFHRLDIRDPAMGRILEGHDVVFHLAAKTCLSSCIEKPIETCQINIEGTVSVLDASRKAGVKQFVFADTSAEYEGIKTFPAKTDCVAPEGIYAVSKRCAGLFCESYSRLFKMDIITVRYFNVYGPAQDWRRVIPPVMSSFIMKSLNGESPIIFGNGEKRRDFIYVDDVNDLHMAIIGRMDLKGKIFNVGTGKNYSIRQIYDIIEAQMKTGLKPVYQEDLPWEAHETLADISESIKCLRWAPKVDIYTGVSKSIEDLKQKVSRP